MARQGYPPCKRTSRIARVVSWSSRQEMKGGEGVRPRVASPPSEVSGKGRRGRVRERERDNKRVI